MASKAKSFYQPSTSNTQIVAAPRRSRSEVRHTDHAQFTRTSTGDIEGVNEYIFEKSLGKGSFAEVKLAHLQDNNTQKFAIKIFKKSFLKQKKNLDTSRRDRRMTVTTALDNVQHEIAIMKKLIHPNIVQLFEVIDDGSADYLFMVLEYVEDGECMSYDPATKTFSSKVTGGTLDEPLAAQYMSDILLGLQYLHAHHICHRDLKPENILLGKDGHIKISDFGVSHIFDEESYRNSYSLKFASRSKSRGQLHKTEGTWYFWSPEMCREDNSYSGYAADLWAVGVILWVFLFGKLPYCDVENPIELFEIIQHHEFVLPNKISPECEHFLFGLLEKNPDLRMVLQDALEHIWIVLNYSNHQSSSVLKVFVSNDEMRNAFTGIANISVGCDDLLPPNQTTEQTESEIASNKEDNEDETSKDTPQIPSSHPEKFHQTWHICHQCVIL